MMTVTFPWPHKDLWPNRGAHWAVLARHRKKARFAGFWLSIKAGVNSLRGSERIEVSVMFVPPDGIRRDTDGMISSIKGHLDGISDAIGIDDSRWIWAAPVMAKPEKPGRVVVTLTPVEVTHGAD
jgi:crossover junction endodeoxyribonuclease RusA